MECNANDQCKQGLLKSMEIALYAFSMWFLDTLNRAWCEPALKDWQIWLLDIDDFVCLLLPHIFKKLTWICCHVNINILEKSESTNGHPAVYLIFWTVLKLKVNKFRKCHYVRKCHYKFRKCQSYIVDKIGKRHRP